MAKKHRSSKSSSKSPSRVDSSRKARKTSRARSGSRSRSTSRSRGASSKKPASSVVKKFDETAADVKKVIPFFRSSKNGSSYRILPFSGKGVRRRPLTMRLLQPIKMDNLKVKGAKLKHRLSMHCKQYSRYYIIVLLLGLIALGIFYTGYTVEQMTKYARERLDIVMAYVQRRG